MTLFERLLIVGIAALVGLYVVMMSSVFAETREIDNHEGRSHLWPEVRKAHLNLEPYCRVCGSERDLEVHHEREFARYPELELDPKNLITLCRHCHYCVGHLEISWRTNNYQIAAVFGPLTNSTGRRVWEVRHP